MKSKPMGALFGVLALVAILSVAPAFGQTANEVDMAKGAGASQTADCVAANNCFNPNPLVVPPGTQVTWRNTDTVSHTVTSGHPSDNATGTIFDSGGLIKPGGTFQFTFQNEGTYDYFCIVHPWMLAQVIVGAGGTPPRPPPVDTTTPTDLFATSVSSSQIDLSWNAPIQNYGKSIIGYQIEWKRSPGDYTVIADNTQNTSTRYSVYQLMPDNSYTYRVSAIYNDQTRS